MSEQNTGNDPRAGAPESPRNGELGGTRPVEPGFVALYGGAGTAGWVQAGPGSFSEVDGTLRAEGGMGLLWYARRPFADFTLRLDWLATRIEDNSGVFVRFPDPQGDPWAAVHQGYEIQIHDAAAGSQATGAIYRVKAPTAMASRPPGEWNALEITVTGRQYTVVVNGIVVNSFASTDPARGLSGHIGIQNHDDDSPVRFRDIRIKDL